jgi:hypothetical protein
MPAADLAPLQSQQTSQHARTGEGELQVQPIQMPHDGEIGGRHWSRQIINAAAADLQNFGLLGDRQIMFTVNHRFALSNPALVSAPSKKLLSAPSATCGDRNGLALDCTRKGAADMILVDITPLKNLVHGLLRT